MTAKIKDSVDVLLILKSNPNLKSLVQNFFKRQFALQVNLTVTDFRDNNRIFYDVIWGKTSVEKLTHKNMLSAIHFVHENELNLAAYLESNRQFLSEKESFGELAECGNTDLPYYSRSNPTDFLNLQLSFLKSYLGEDFARIESRLLTEVVGSQNLTFPVADLLNTNHPFSINQKVELSSQSQTEVPQAFIDAVKSFMPDIQDNQTFTLQSIDSDKGQITCNLSSYFKTLLSCDRWYYEMVSRYSPDQSSQELYLKSDFLSLWAEQLKQNILDNTFVADQSIGGSCLCVYKTEDGYEYLLGHKAIGANGFNDMHVLPSFMFQPLTKNPLKFGKELSVRSKVLQELAEEVFKYEEFEADGHDKFLQKQINDLPENAELLKLLKTGRAEFKITGLWLDIYRLRPEITSILIVNDESWFSKFFTPETKIGNWEINPGGVFDFSYNKSNYENILLGHAGNLCPPGAAAFIAGNRYLKETTQVS